MTRLLALAALGAALMTVATVVYLTHRRQPVSAPLYRDWAEPFDFMCPNCLTPWRCNGPHEPMFV